MFYESERQMRKQQSYEKSRVYDLINSLKAKDLTSKQILSHINVMASAVNNTETQQEVLAIAKKIVGVQIDREIAYEIAHIIPIDSINI